MKTRHQSAVKAIAIVMILLAPAIAVAQSGKKKEPRIPSGWLSAFPTLVQSGTHPTLTWDIQYPESVLNILLIDNSKLGAGGVTGVGSGSLTPRVDLNMNIQVIGAANQIGIDKRGRPIWGYVQAAHQTSSGHDLFFSDTHDDVNPSATYRGKTVPAMEKIDFGGSAHNGSTWSNVESTGSTGSHVVVLIDGDTPPPAFSSRPLEENIKPYIDAGGKISIGPKHVLVLFELIENDPAAPGYDLQDLVLLVSFDYPKNNNGHGNNIDGVDSSNPGNAPFIDSDPNVDDEGSGGGAYPSK